METKQKRILCIDGNASRNLAIYLLERAGFEVQTASSLADGIEMAQHQVFDLYLLNHTLLKEAEISSCDELTDGARRAPILFYSTVLYPYEPYEPVRCRRHSHMLMPVSVCEVQRSALKLVNKQTRSSNEPVQWNNSDVAIAGPRAHSVQFAGNSR